LAIDNTAILFANDIEGNNKNKMVETIEQFCSLKNNFICCTCSVQNIHDKKFLKELGKHIAFLRKTKKITQLDLAVRMDNHAEQINCIERGQLDVTICT
jgi:hypothetical protein